MHAIEVIAGHLAEMSADPNDRGEILDAGRTAGAEIVGAYKTAGRARREVAILERQVQAQAARLAEIVERLARLEAGPEAPETEGGASREELLWFVEKLLTYGKWYTSAIELDQHAGAVIDGEELWREAKALVGIGAAAAAEIEDTLAEPPFGHYVRSVPGLSVSLNSAGVTLRLERAGHWITEYVPWSVAPSVAEQIEAAVERLEVTLGRVIAERRPRAETVRCQCGEGELRNWEGETYCTSCRENWA